jgi:hypothetical protein
MAAPTVAQEQSSAMPPPVASAPTPVEPTVVRFQVTNFEALLRNAVMRGGQELATKTQQVAPGLALAPLSDPIVHGWAQPDFGYVFYVETPGISATGVAMLMMQQQSPSSPVPTKPVAGASPAPPPGTVAATSLVAPDPMFEPNAFYSEAVRQALYDAILDNSGGLPIKEDEHLAISAAPKPMPPLFSNPLYPDSRRLVLTIKGADLILFRQGRLPREDAKLRILETRF